MEADIAGPAWNVYLGLADLYEGFRPGYPPEAAQHVAAQLGRSRNAGTLLDIGCGTGKFARSLADCLAGTATLIGIEPNDDMRRSAIAASGGYPALRFEKGSAERIPASDGSAVLVTAASAAHWFDRAHFYPEVERVLRPGGCVAILQNKLRSVEGGLADALEAFYEGHLAGYRRGTYPTAAGTYAEADFEAELNALPNFTAASMRAWHWDMPVSEVGFIAYACSTSGTSRIRQRIGADATIDRLTAAFRRHCGRNAPGVLSWRTEATVAMLEPGGTRPPASP